MLREWLNGSREYTSDVRLNQRYGKDAALLRMFSESESEFKKKKLITVLEGVWDSRNGVKNPVSARGPAKPSNSVPFTLKKRTG